MMKRTSSRSSDEKFEFDTVLQNELGQFGKFQLINIVLIAVPAIVSGFMAGDYIFTAAKLPHRCTVPDCDTVPAEYAPSWILNAIPLTNSGAMHDCRRYVAINETVRLPTDEDVCPAHRFDKNSTIACESFVYERTNSAVYDFGLECQDWLIALAGTLNSLGGMFALPVAGFISDYFGRRTSIVLFSFNIALVGFIRSFSVNYAMYATLQFMQTAIGGGAFSAAYILATELVGPKFRVRTSATMSSMFALGQVLLGLIASAVYEWRMLSITLFTPVFLLISYHWILTESFRWLLSKGKHKEARKTLETAARMNGRQISEIHMEFLLNAIPSQTEESESVAETSLFMRVIKSPVLLRRCCTTPVWWVTTTFVYYGLSINSVSLSGNMYHNYMATAAVEIPGFWSAVLMLDRIGRKPTLFFGYLLCSVCCIGFAFLPDSYARVSMSVFLLGKFSIALVFTSVYLFTSELYPTKHRHSLLAFSSMVGRVGSIVAPLTPPLAAYWTGIPSLLFGITAMISALLVLTQPETLGQKLPDTIEDAERLSKKY